MASGLRTTQSKATDLLRETAERAGYELVADYSFSNIGTYRFQPVDAIRTTLRIGFDFQTDGVTLSFNGQVPSVSVLRTYPGTARQTCAQIRPDDSRGWASLVGWVNGVLRADKQYRAERATRTHDHDGDTAGTFRGAHAHDYQESDDHYHADVEGEAAPIEPR